MEKVKFIMLCGLPASGKSTYCEQYKHDKDWAVLSSDEIRAELCGDVNDQSKNELVFKLLHQRVKDDLRAGKNVIYDATNLNRKRRIAFLHEIKNISCEKICVLFATPWEQCLANNFTRDRQVPEEAMTRMYSNYDAVWYSEGWDDIQIVWWKYETRGDFGYNINLDIERWKEISHNSPYHSLSIGEHMEEAYKYMSNQTNDDRLLAAALLHDCGKPDVKAYINSKGEQTEIAHYYNHESCGAYKSLFYLKDKYPKWSDSILYVSLLINLHMRYHLAYKQSEKAKEKDRKLFGDKVMSDLETLYLADLAAH